MRSIQKQAPHRDFNFLFASLLSALLVVIGWLLFRNPVPNLYATRNEITSQPIQTDGNVLASEVQFGSSVSTADVPIVNPQPPSTLLPPGTTTLTLTVQSAEQTHCSYSREFAASDAAMTPFDQGTGTTFHQTSISQLDPEPNVVNKIFVRCASHPDYVLPLQYRSLSQVNPSFPRIGNLWGWWDLKPRGLPYMSRIDLWLAAAHAPPDEIRTLRTLNPDMLILTNINAVDADDLPDDYYLKDIYGNRLEIRPGYYRLNLTKPHVAEYQARYAYEQASANDFMFDGVFFDNVLTTQSWKKFDVYGNRFVVDADEDGVEDDPDAFDAAWKAGVLHELEVFRKLMPHAIVTGHGQDLEDAGIAEIFNGISLGFRTADVLEDEMLFADLWREYQAWSDQSRAPRVTMIEASPPDQIAYGYGYAPWNQIPNSTLEFARTYYPYVRFGLALALMQDGYFTYEFGDTWHGNDWWYDELDFDLGYPLGPAHRIEVSPSQSLDGVVTEDQISNGGFEAAIDEAWRLLFNDSQGGKATLSHDTSKSAVGMASARIDVSAASNDRHHIKLAQSNHSLSQDTVYDVAFWAKSTPPRTITLSVQKEDDDKRGYGLWHHLPIDDKWEQYTVSFDARESANDARLQFLVGDAVGSVWLDDVRFQVRPPDVYQRKFSNGLVLLNGSNETQEISLPFGYRRLQGQQAPRYDIIIDDKDTAFSTTGAWTKLTYDSGELKASGPYYHCWKEECHERNSTGGDAYWDLKIDADDVYTITAWWPAGPAASSWNQAVTYSVLAGEDVLASATFDQRDGGDQWHVVAAVPLAQGTTYRVRMQCQGDATCIADAIHMRSHARYNDGAAVTTVSLQPRDGIILTRTSTHKLHLASVHK